MTSLDPEVLLATAYAAILLASAYGLDALARHSHRRAEAYGNGGFRFHPHVDAWECPEGEYLHVETHDRERRLVRYRARPLVCNACPAKTECTDSDEGRELVRSLDAWPLSEAGRFHRIVSLTLVALAALIPAVVLVRHHEPAEALLLGSVVAAAAVAARSLAAELRARPTDPHLVA